MSPDDIHTQTASKLFKVIAPGDCEHCLNFKESGCALGFGKNFRCPREGDQLTKQEASIGDKVTIIHGELAGEECTVTHVWPSGSVDAVLETYSTPIQLLPWEWTPLGSELVKCLKDLVNKRTP